MHTSFDDYHKKYNYNKICFYLINIKSQFVNYIKVIIMHHAFLVFDAYLCGNRIFLYSNFSSIFTSSFSKPPYSAMRSLTTLANVYHFSSPSF